MTDLICSWPLTGFYLNSQESCDENLPQCSPWFSLRPVRTFLNPILPLSCSYLTFFLFCLFKLPTPFSSSPSDSIRFFIFSFCHIAISFISLLRSLVSLYLALLYAFSLLVICYLIEVFLFYLPFPLPLLKSSSLHSFFPSYPLPILSLSLLHGWNFWHHRLSENVHKNRCMETRLLFTSVSAPLFSFQSYPFHISFILPLSTLVPFLLHSQHHPLSLSPSSFFSSPLVRLDQTA